MNFINKRISFYIRPEFIFRPKQLIWHIKQKLRPKPNEFESVNLPCGAPIRIRPFDFIGIHIWWYGVYDLCVSEAIWRLLDPGVYLYKTGCVESLIEVTKQALKDSCEPKFRNTIKAESSKLLNGSNLAASIIKYCI